MEKCHIISLRDYDFKTKQTIIDIGCIEVNNYIHNQIRIMFHVCYMDSIEELS